MSQDRSILDLVTAGNAVAFRQAFADRMNAKMAERILFSAPKPVNETVMSEEKKLSPKEKALAKTAYEAGKESSDDEDEGDASDLFLFQNSDQVIDKAKEIVLNYNDSHTNDRLETKIFKTDNGIRFFVSGDEVGRRQVRNLLRGIGGKLQS